jgi:hypothetical protein
MLVLLAGGDFSVHPNVLLVVFPLLTLALVVWLVVWLAKR